MDKLICFCFALLTSLYVSSSSAENSPVLPKSYSLDDSYKQELPVLPAYNEPSQSRNNSYMGEIRELQPVSNTYTENESVTISTKFTDEGNDVNTSKDHLPPIFIDFEHKNDVGSSPTLNTNNYYLGSSRPTKAFLPLGNKSAESGGETTDTTKHDKTWFYQEEEDNDNEDYRDNEGLKDGSDEYMEDGDDDIVLGEHDNDDDDDDEEYDVTKWSEHGDDVNESDWDDGTEDDFDELKNPQDEVASKKRQPTAPTKMVLFYTWMVVAVLLIIVGVSTYQSRCRGFRFFGAKAQNPKDDRKRLMEHEFV